MKINIDEITQSFAPRISYNYVRDYFRIDEEIQVNNDAFYAKMEKLTGRAYPSSLPTEEIRDTRWEYFYLPMKRENRLICTPIFVMLYRSLYYVWFHGINQAFGSLAVGKGSDEVPGDYDLFIDESIRFIPLMKETGNKIVEQTYPYDYRQGKIRTKYFLKKETLMTAKERNEIEIVYKNFLKKKLVPGKVTLNDYLNTAATCYRGAFKEEADKMTPGRMYKRWADNRHFGMLDIDPESKNEFSHWLKTNGRRGSHPFEIVYSPVKTGIHLYPPDEENSFYNLTVTATHQTGVFIRMIVALVKHNVPFKTFHLENALNDLTGEKLVDVNSMDRESFSYYSSPEYREKYFPYIQWDEIKIIKCR